MFSHLSQACTWCVCKDMPDAVLQKALDYACGAGADCNPTRQNGQCFQPNTVRAHCSYAVNSYYQKKGQSQGSCDFSGAATISTSDPSNFLVILSFSLFQNHHCVSFSVQPYITADAVFFLVVIRCYRLLLPCYCQVLFLFSNLLTLARSG